MLNLNVELRGVAQTLENQPGVDEVDTGSRVDSLTLNLFE